MSDETGATEPAENTGEVHEPIRRSALERAQSQKGTAQAEMAVGGIGALVVIGLICWGLFSAGAWAVNGFNAVRREGEEAQAMVAAYETQQAAQRSGVASDTAMIAGAQIAIKSRAVDPNSVRFRNVRAYRQASRTKAVCGEFNAKNRTGGYSGFERFVSAGVGRHTWIESEVADFDAAWASLCQS